MLSKRTASRQFVAQIGQTNWKNKKIVSKLISKIGNFLPLQGSYLERKFSSGSQPPPTRTITVDRRILTKHVRFELEICKKMYSSKLVFSLERCFKLTLYFPPPRRCILSGTAHVHFLSSFCISSSMITISAVDWTFSSEVINTSTFSGVYSTGLPSTSSKTGSDSSCSHLGSITASSSSFSEGGSLRKINSEINATSTKTMIRCRALWRVSLVVSQDKKSIWVKNSSSNRQAAYIERMRFVGNIDWHVYQLWHTKMALLKWSICAQEIVVSCWDLVS